MHALTFISLANFTIDLPRALLRLCVALCLSRSHPCYSLAAVEIGFARYDGCMAAFAKSKRRIGLAKINWRQA